MVDKALDYEETSEYKFIVRASDNDPQRPLSALSTLSVKIQDENDNSPHFPIMMYNEFVEENAPIGTSVFVAHAVDADRGMYGKVNYSLTEGEGTDKFRIDMESGMVTTAVVFDYESKSRYFFTLMAVDPGNKYATVQVQVDIEGRDEYPPEFSQSNYHFTVPADAPVGFVAGRVQALDKDEGPDGRVFYHLRNKEAVAGLAVNSTSGAIVVTGSLRKEYSRRRKKREAQDVALYVVATSGRQNSLSGMAVVGVTIDHNLNASANAGEDKQLSSALPGWGLGLMITLAILAVVLLSLVFLLRLRTKRNGNPKPVMSGGFDNSFDTIDIRHPPSSSGSLSQFPPHYNDISQFDPTESTGHMNAAISEVSDQSHSASSGRGSAEEGEDVEDEEIRMINEGPLLQQQKMHGLSGLPDSVMSHRGDDDDLSDISVQNTQEYLARLGINTTMSPSPTIVSPSINQGIGRRKGLFQDEVPGVEVDEHDHHMGHLIYSKLDEVGDEVLDGSSSGSRAFGGFGEMEGEPSMTGSLSSIVHSEEELTGSYNWDYLLDWGPQYQPLAHVFAEIARLKDDSPSSSYVAGPLKKTLSLQVKSLPPPLITNVAPRSIAPVALSSSGGHHPGLSSQQQLPRSPISHDATFLSPAMSPSFTPSLSPLATRSPSISPMIAPSILGGPPIHGPSIMGTPHHTRQQRNNMMHNNPNSSSSETELHL